MTWDYAITVRRVVDGDTLDCTVDLGFHLTALLRFRLHGVDTPELNAAGGAAARDYVTAWVAARPGLRARTYKADSFGRWLADIYYVPAVNPVSTLDVQHLAAALLADGHAVLWRRNAGGPPLYP